MTIEQRMIYMGFICEKGTVLVYLSLTGFSHLGPANSKDPTSMLTWHNVIGLKIKYLVLFFLFILSNSRLLLSSVFPEENNGFDDYDY